MIKIAILSRREVSELPSRRTILLRKCSRKEWLGRSGGQSIYKESSSVIRVLTCWYWLRRIPARGREKTSISCQLTVKSCWQPFCEHVLSSGRGSFHEKPPAAAAARADGSGAGHAALFRGHFASTRKSPGTPHDYRDSWILCRLLDSLQRDDVLVSCSLMR